MRVRSARAGPFGLRREVLEGEVEEPDDVLADTERFETVLAG